MNETEANEYLGRSRCYLRDLRCSGREHPPFTRVGKRLVYTKEDLDAWKKQFLLAEGEYCEESASLYLGKNIRYLSLRVTKGEKAPPYHIKGFRRYYMKEDLDAWLTK
jgi:hypothetical protein